MLKLAATVGAHIRQARILRFATLPAIDYGHTTTDTSASSVWAILSDPIVIALACATALFLLSWRKVRGKTD